MTSSQCYAHLRTCYMKIQNSQIALKLGTYAAETFSALMVDGTVRQMGQWGKWGRCDRLRYSNCALKSAGLPFMSPKAKINHVYQEIDDMQYVWYLKLHCKAVNDNEYQEKRA